METDRAVGRTEPSVPWTTVDDGGLGRQRKDGAGRTREAIEIAGEQQTEYVQAYCIKYNGLGIELANHRLQTQLGLGWTAYAWRLHCLTATVQTPDLSSTQHHPYMTHFLCRTLFIVYVDHGVHTYLYSTVRTGYRYIHTRYSCRV
jgi:hypothetical protein